MMMIIVFNNTLSNHCFLLKVMWSLTSHYEIGPEAHKYAICLVQSAILWHYNCRGCVTLSVVFYSDGEW